jgi:hypothetical protein
LAPYHLSLLSFLLSSFFFLSSAHQPEQQKKQQQQPREHATSVVESVNIVYIYVLPLKKLRQIVL